MAAFLISYDLKKPVRDYSTLYEGIKNQSGNWCHVLESVWIITANNSNCTQIRDALSQYVDPNDQLLVVRLQGEGAWLNLSPEISNWLQKNL